MSDAARRIALVHPYAWPEVRRGGERYLDDLAWYLASAGHDVDVITGTEGSSEVVVADGVTARRRHHAVPGPLRRRGVSPVDTFGAVALPALVRRYDVVHALTPTAAVVARAAGQRTLYTVLGHPTEDQFGRRPFDRRLVAVGVRAATEVVALSAASAAQVETMFGRRPGVLPPGVRTDRFIRKQARRRGAPRILFSADASDPRKGVDLALAAIAALRQRRPGARLLLSGAGDPRWALDRLDAEQARRAQEATDVLGPGDLGDVAARYRDATVTLLPARHEAFGLALVESLASGTPVVCSRDGGMPEIVSDSAVGAVFPRDDVDGLVGALDATIDLAGRPETTERCAAHARRWDWETAVGPAHEAVYDALVARRRSTPS